MNKTNSLQTQGYLIVEKYNKIFNRFIKHVKTKESIYGIPYFGSEPNNVSKHYRGIYRMPLDPFSDEQAALPKLIEPRREDAAQRYLVELEKDGKLVEGLVADLNDIFKVYDLIDKKNDYEILSVSIKSNRKSKNEILGYDVSYFYADHFSAICDSLFFPQWHGTDNGTLFKESYNKLNNNGLFNTESDALEFLELYTSLDWTETGDFYIVEVTSIKQ